jgi:hypothetical protein
MPYSCHAQCGRSGTCVTFVGGGSTCRGIGRLMSHTSTLTMGHTIIRASPGNLSGGRSTIAEYGRRCDGFMDEGLLSKQNYCIAVSGYRRDAGRTAIFLSLWCC